MIFNTNLKGLNEITCKDGVIKLEDKEVMELVKDLFECGWIPRAPYGY